MTTAIPDPPGFEHLLARSALVLPLCYAEDSVGLTLMPLGDRDGAFYEILAEVFGAVVKALDVRRRAESR